MKVLILEDDELIADLLETVVSGLYPGVFVQICERVGQACATWETDPADLVIADWNLPDGSGLNLVKAVRRASRSTPVVIITGRSDRESILAAASLGINGYISKPFTIELVHERLASLIKPVAQDAAGLPSLSERLKSATESSGQLPGTIGAGAVLALLERQDDLTPAQLAERWKQEPALSAKLLDVANHLSLRRSGQPVQSVKDAITAIGVPMALNQALALSMDIAGKLPDRRLQNLAVEYQARAEKVAFGAQKLAIFLREKGERYFTAGLLSRIGELMTLRVIQQHLDAGGELGDEEINRMLAEWARKLGNSMKIQWRLSLEMRELIGAVYLLRKGSVAQDHVIMNAAGMVANGEGESDECRRLLRRLGIDDKKEEQTDGK